MAVSVDQFRKELWATLSRQHDMVARAHTSEQELESAQASLLEMRYSLQVVRMECDGLKKRSEAVDAMFAARSNKGTCLALTTRTAHQLQNELATKKVLELARKDACQRLKVEEWKLQNRADCLEHNTQTLLRFDSSVDTKPRLDNTRWSDSTLRQLNIAQPQPQFNLEEVRKNEEIAVMEAKMAETALENARHLALQACEEPDLSAQHKAKKEADGVVRALQRQISAVRMSNADRRMHLISSWASPAVLEQQAEEDLSIARILKKTMREDTIAIASFCKQANELTMKSVAIEEANNGTRREELREMAQWRRLAAVSPIFAAWLVTIWWLITGAFIN